LHFFFVPLKSNTNWFGILVAAEEFREQYARVTRQTTGRTRSIHQRRISTAQGHHLARIHALSLTPSWMRIVVLLFEGLLHRGHPTLFPWGVPLLAWGYLQYRLVGNYRLPRAGGSAGMEVPPERVIKTGPYRYTRNPMYLGHLIFMMGLVVTFWSWFALVVFVAHAL
jgi:protein-S-isoprenylcysteine O-methyltransferase Ste14